MSKSKKPRLGRGLNSLMSNSVSVNPPQQSEDVDGASDEVNEASDAVQKPSGNELSYIPLDAITPNPHQPRQTFNDEQIQSLADSIAQDGVMQPIVVRPSAAVPGQMELVAGERRLRAAEVAGLDSIPAVVRDLTDQQIAEWALIENLQRQDLNAIESAHAFVKLSEQFGMTHDQIAERVGLSRVAVTNTIRLLDLDDSIVDSIRAGVITAGHGRALLQVKSPTLEKKLAQEIVRGGWSVRFTEKVIRDRVSPSVSRETTSRTQLPDAHLADLADQIGQQLQTKVSIKKGRKKGAGTLMIDFYDLDHFDSIVEKMNIKID